MLYVERTPSALLRPWVRMLWYCCAPEIGHARERVLANGCLQILLNLRAESLTGCGTDGFGAGRTAGALVMGARSRFEVIATEDLAEIAGAVIEPGGFGQMFRMRADLLEGGSAALTDVWSGMSRRIVERMCEAQSVAAKLEVMEAMLQSRIDESLRRSTLVDASLREMRRPGVTVRAYARAAGVSERRLLEVFRAEVGLGPKTWLRVRRFQAAVRALHRGMEVRWADLALGCGYYDQSHFANEFREFPVWIRRPTVRDGDAGRIIWR